MRFILLAVCLIFFFDPISFIMIKIPDVPKSPQQALNLEADEADASDGKRLPLTNSRRKGF
jgi:hypothetical protein